MNRPCSAPLLVLGALWITAATASAGGAGPFEWQTATPESQGMSREKLDALKGRLAARKTKALLVIRNDKVVYEWYAEGHSATKTHFTASAAKALVGGLSLGLALTDGLITLDDRAAKYIPQWRDDRRKSKITIRHLGSHTSGLDDSRPNEEAKWKDDFWKRQEPPNDPFTISRDKTPVLFDPGEKFRYSNPGIGMLTYAVTAALKDAPVKDIRTLLRQRVMRPIGVPDREWSIGYGQTFTVDGLPLVGSWGGGGYTARAAARVGRLMLRQGDWDGKRLLSKEAVRQITADAGTPGHCGMGWWSNNEGEYAKLPKDAFFGSGAGHQIVLVVPSLNLIAVRNGQELGAAASEPSRYHQPVRQFLFEPLMGAISDRASAPYPASRVITRLDWDTKDAIVRQAKGSDNWPMTWGEDDHLYTAYGDGWGFDPKVPIKLGLGLACIEGGPDGFKGVNIRSATGEQLGDGPKSRKASGMLMVDGVLYLWARNAGNAQLAWSKDRGKTWTWADWKLTTGFGCPTFINYGKNYAGARDQFVYICSHDNDSAYETADRLVLARVPKDKIRQRDDYEFFKGVDAKGEPTWTKEVKERGGVFTHKGSCYRCAVTYNSALRRYLLVMSVPGAGSRDKAGRRDTRFTGGLAVYDASEPWGPWTTVFFTDRWDVGPGESASFPTRWMSTDGKTLYLVFSGEDCFSVRRATLTVAAKP